MGHDVEQIGKSFMKNWSGNPYTIQDGIDDSYSIIPAERELSYNLRMAHLYDPQTERTMRFSNTYFQNSVSEWNRLDVSERSCTTISEFKKRLLLRIRLSKRSIIFNIHDLIGIKLLT